MIDDDNFHMEEGSEIHERAGLLYPTAIMVTGDNITAAETTAKLLKDPQIAVILEAPFLTDNCVARADTLIRKDSAWKIIEVKSIYGSVCSKSSGWPSVCFFL